MKELNKHILSKAIDSLPEHEPNDAIWDYIQDDLVHEFGDARLREKLQTLPSYDPPEMVWNHINSNLDGKPQSAARVISFSNWRRVSAIAASFAILMFSGWWILNTDTNTNDGLAYSTEEIDTELFKQDWDDDEGAFEELMQLCKIKLATCQEPDFQKLQAELDELNDAKIALKNALGKFGTDPNLIAQIKDLELERTDKMKKMIDKLI